ncbi:MAG: hypothetical protein KJ558_10015 [Gammaproteobacteria bacterium]|nr:hypothetical protein [Gammaproteobacteria bacterium]MBU1959683.1 hypothetical protein [Gammaproteobacteria bacterium]
MRVKITRTGGPPAADRFSGRIRVTYQSDVVGSGVFWEGDPIGIPGIRNLCARDLAVAVSRDGVSRRDGMWRAEVVPDAEAKEAQ